MLAPGESDVDRASVVINEPKHGPGLRIYDAVQEVAFGIVNPAFVWGTVGILYHVARHAALAIVELANYVDASGHASSSSFDIGSLGRTRSSVSTPFSGEDTLVLSRLTLRLARFLGLDLSPPFELP
jgi:hypothetical protein